MACCRIQCQKFDRIDQPSGWRTGIYLEMRGEAARGWLRWDRQPGTGELRHERVHPSTHPQGRRAAGGRAGVAAAAAGRAAQRHSWAGRALRPLVCDAAAKCASGDVPCVLLLCYCLAPAPPSPPIAPFLFPNAACKVVRLPPLSCLCRMLALASV